MKTKSTKNEPIMDQKEFKQKLTQLFREARKLGATAKQNFSCCNSCATYELNTIAKEDQPVLFYHKQNNVKDGNVYLGYFCASQKDIEYEKHSKTFAHAICHIAENLGLIVSWNGDTSRKIWVGAYEKPAHY